MKIAHIAIYTNNLENMRDFYCQYFGGTSNHKYRNAAKAFESYFIRFEQGTQIELMHKAGVEQRNTTVEQIGITHLAFQLASEIEVLALTETLRQAGYVVASEARTTGDGYFESVILDPEGNRIELVA
jgi:catechol 2,3-dioxygenase-like lactoylglutathione lyase family enzyme